MSTSQRTSARQIPDSSRRSYTGGYTKDRVDYEEVDITMTPSGKHKEKTHLSHTDGEGYMEKPTPLVATPPVVTAPPCDEPSGWNCMSLVWIILIFVIILIIVMGCLWAFKPSCVTRECDSAEDGCELDLARAALYAFFFTFFLVIIGCAIWYCCGSSRKC